ncbi:MAG: hypothetical protein GY754_17605 [bacterium]|nr:hypothetical protein [bacterium]
MAKKINIPKPVFFIILLFVLILPCPVFPGVPLVIHDEQDNYKLNKYLEYFEDKKRTLSIKDITSSQYNNRFIQNNNTRLNLGFKTPACWVRCTLLYSGNKKNQREKEWMLEVDYPHLDYVTLYFPLPKGGWKEIKTGDRLPFTSRPVHFHNFVFKIPLKPGTAKTIYLRIQTSGSLQAPLILRSKTGMREKINNKQIVIGIFYGIIMIMVLYNLFIYFSIRERAYLFYVIHIFIIILVHLSFYGHSFEYLWPKHPMWANYAVLFTMSTSCFSAFLFSREYLQTKKLFPVMNKIFLIAIFCMLFITAVTFILPYQIAIQINTVAVFMTANTILISGIRCLQKKYKPARYFLTAWIFPLVGGTLGPLSLSGIIPLNFITYNAVLIGTSIEVVLLSLALADRINIINREKEKAQEKYQSLVEGSTDIIFTLDEKLRFISVNKAIKAILLVTPESVLSKEFSCLLYEEPGRAAMAKQLVRQQFEIFAKKRKPVSFKTRFKLPIHTEFKEMQVHLEYLNTEGKHEILGKARSISEDAFLTYFVSEKQKMLIGNFIHILDEITFRLTRNLYTYIKPVTVNLVRIGLREIITNAIEHGNLNISYDKKTEALLSSNYLTVLANRQTGEINKDRKVSIDFEIDEQGVQYIITDEGDGFDYKKIMRFDISDRNKKKESHGRGLIMAQDIFDSIEFNTKGNRVVLVKKFTSKNTCNPSNS